MGDIYKVYHYPRKKKVGLTVDEKYRVEEQQGIKPGDYEILHETPNLFKALDLEQEENNSRGYKPTNRWHPHLKRYSSMRFIKHFEKDKLSTTIGWYETIREEINNGITIEIPEGSFVFDTPEMLDDLAAITHKGDYTTKLGDGFIYIDKMIAIHDKHREKRMNIIGQNGNTGEHYDVSNKTLDDVFALQLKLQGRFKETEDIGKQSLVDTAISAQRNLHAFLDEFMEFMNALGGENHGIGKNAWKYWGKLHEAGKSMTLADLSDQDLEDLKYEYIDMFHFFINFGLMIGMTGQEVIDMYVIKNKENFKRQDDGYDPSNK